MMDRGYMMHDSLSLEQPDFTDLIMYQCGMEDCRPLYSYGPAVRDHFLIHYIMDGCGTLEIEGKSYFLKKGQGFLIWPNTVSFYQADMDDPWSYAWIGFSGMKAEYYLKKSRLDRNNIIFNFTDFDFVRQCFDKMLSVKSLRNGREIRLHGYLFILISQLLEEVGDSRLSEKGQNKDFYVKKAVEYIMMNYSRELSVGGIAQYIGIDRSYLSMLFKSNFNMSPRLFLINFRIKKACELLSNNSLSIGDIARSVGYQDALVFSKAFKNIMGVSPRKYRQTYLNNSNIIQDNS